MDALIFACAVTPNQSDWQALLFARSLRDFGGEFARAPVHVYVHDVAGYDEELHWESEFDQLGVELRPNPLTADQARFPFAPKVMAAAAAEREASTQTSLLVWVDAHTLILQPPAALVIPPGCDVGYRPVDHKLIGSMYDQPLDRFWELIYQVCEVSDDAVFPMRTSVDDLILRPYFNAGNLVVRPEHGLLQAWCRRFLQTYQHPAFKDLYEAESLYQIFMHQAILAGEILAHYQPASLERLPAYVNYPAHLHWQTPAERRPAQLDELVSCRYDTLAGRPYWWRDLPASEGLRTWLEDVLSALG